MKVKQGKIDVQNEQMSAVAHQKKYPKTKKNKKKKEGKKKKFQIEIFVCPHLNIQWGFDVVLDRNRITFEDV